MIAENEEIAPVALVRGAWLSLIQAENECVPEKAGRPCHSHKCGCALEMQAHIDAAKEWLI